MLVLMGSRCWEREMPSTSPKQKRTMRAAKHNPEFAKKMGIPQKVAAEFVAADQQQASQKTTSKSTNQLLPKGRNK